MKTIFKRALYIAFVTLIYIGANFNAPAWADKNEQHTVFFASMEDIPLKSGLTELIDQTMIYDKPEGRIIESIAHIDFGSDQDIMLYYKQSLPQLGWSPKKDGSYIRNNEHLKMKFENFDGERFFRLMIEPR